MSALRDQTRQICTPNERVSRDTIAIVVAAWCAIWLVFWFVFRPAIFPSPFDVIRVYPALWFDEGLGQELFASLRINVEALAVSTALVLPLAYLSRIPAVQPVAIGLSKLRFLSPAAFFVPLLFLTRT